MGLFFGLCFWLQRQYLKLSIVTLSIALCVYSLGWGGGPVAKASSAIAPSLTLLSMNVHEQTAPLRDFMADEGFEADILCLQEVSDHPRQTLIQTLPNYEFYGDVHNREKTASEGAAYTSIIGLRKSSFETNRVEITPAITGYRTFAVTAQLKQQPKFPREGLSIELAQQPTSIAIANIHTTKALVFHSGIKGFITQTPAKAARHINERHRLETWAAAQTVPVIVAGDFNAPYGSVGARIQGFHSSHHQAGKGPLLTFPSELPLLGIDHIQGNAQIQFHSSLVLAADFSDHLPQVADFSLNSSTKS